MNYADLYLQHIRDREAIPGFPAELCVDGNTALEGSPSFDENVARYRSVPPESLPDPRTNFTEEYISHLARAEAMTFFLRAENLRFVGGGSTTAVDPYDATSALKFITLSVPTPTVEEEQDEPCVVDLGGSPTEAFVADVYRFDARGDVDGAIDLVYERFLDWLDSDDTRQVSAVFEAVDVRRVSVETALAFLTITVPAAQQILGRLAFYERVRGHLLSLRDPGDVERLLYGLR
jgi:hypothetical protein